MAARFSSAQLGSGQQQEEEGEEEGVMGASRESVKVRRLRQGPCDLAPDSNSNVWVGQARACFPVHMPPSAPCCCVVVRNWSPHLQGSLLAWAACPGPSRRFKGPLLLAGVAI